MPASVRHLALAKRPQSDSINCVLAKWPEDGLYYTVEILDCDATEKRCQVLYEDGQKGWVPNRDLHLQLEPNFYLISDQSASTINGEAGIGVKIEATTTAPTKQGSQTISDKENAASSIGGTVEMSDMTVAGETTLDSSGDVVDERVVCCVCDEDSSKAPNEIIICDFCQQGYHVNCHQPIVDRELARLDDEACEWVCATCTIIEDSKDSSPVVSLTPSSANQISEPITSATKTGSQIKVEVPKMKTTARRASKPADTPKSTGKKGSSTNGHSSSRVVSSANKALKHKVNKVKLGKPKAFKAERMDPSTKDTETLEKDNIGTKQFVNLIDDQVTAKVSERKRSGKTKTNRKLSQGAIKKAKGKSAAAY